MVTVEAAGDLPGMSVPEAHAKPHRPMTEEELHRYNCPPGSIILATEEVAETAPLPPPPCDIPWADPRHDMQQAVE